MRVNLFALLFACKNVDFGAKLIPVRLVYLRVALGTKEEIEALLRKF